MSATHDRPPEASGGQSSQPRRRYQAVACLVVLSVGAIVVFSYPVAAEDTSPPELGNVTIVDETSFELAVEDDENVDEGSINAGDFSLSTGTIESIQVNESGNGSVVTVSLTDPIKSDNTTLTLDGSIADEAGNELTDGEVTVEGIDGFAPLLKEYDVSWIGTSTVEIAFHVDEPLGNATLAINGPESTVLGLDDLTDVETPPANDYRFAVNRSFEAEGAYEITLEQIEDEYGNGELYFASRDVVHDTTDPIARINGPSTTTVDKAVTLDGNESSDNTEVDSYQWTIGENVTSENATFTHTFEEPGRHDVSLTVTDARNNTETAYHSIEVLDATTSKDVNITATNGTGVEAVIGPDRDKQRVLVERSGSLAGNGTASLDSLTLTVPTNATANLTTAATTGAPASFDGNEDAAFETFEVDHEGAAVSDVTFRFSVNRTALDARNLSVDGVSLYRDSGGWTRLPTLRVGGNDTHAQYRATSPGLSRFVIAGSEKTAGGDTGDTTTGETGAENDGTQDADDPDGAPAFAIVDGSLLTRNATAGQPIVVRATVVNDGNATGTYVAGLTVNGTVVRTTPVTVPPGEQREITIAEAVPHGGTVSLNGTRLGTVAFENGGAVEDAADGGGGIPIPNPLSLWPGGLFGRVLGAFFWLIVVLYSGLKGLAIYLGY